MEAHFNPSKNNPRYFWFLLIFKEFSKPTARHEYHISGEVSSININNNKPRTISLIRNFSNNFSLKIIPRNPPGISPWASPGFFSQKNRFHREIRDTSNNFQECSPKKSLEIRTVFSSRNLRIYIFEILTRSIIFSIWRKLFLGIFLWVRN